MAVPNACRMCGATSYGRVIERDAKGAMRATGLYRCSGCSVVFADPLQWRSTACAPRPADACAAVPAPPDFRRYGLTPRG